MTNYEYSSLFEGIQSILRCRNSIDFVVISPLCDKFQRIKYKPITTRDATWDVKIEVFSQKLFNAYLQNRFVSYEQSKKRWDDIVDEFTTGSYHISTHNGGGHYYSEGWFRFDNIRANSAEEYLNYAKIAYLSIKERLNCRIDIYAKEYVFDPKVSLKNPIKLNESDLNTSDLTYLNNKIDVFINKCKDTFDEVIIGKIASDCALSKAEIYDNKELIETYREMIKIKSFLYAKNTLIKIQS